MMVLACVWLACFAIFLEMVHRAEPMEGEG